MLYLLTGKQGSGKSFVAEELAGPARIVRVDSILTAIGYKIGAGDPTDWDLWRSAAKDGSIQGLLRLGLELRFAAVKRFNGPVLAEGSILANRWFADPLLAAIAEHTAQRDVASRRYYLDVSNAQLFKNIRMRAERDPCRRHELKQFPDESALAVYHKHFDEVMASPDNQDWIRFRDADKLVQEFQAQMRRL